MNLELLRQHEAHKAARFRIASAPLKLRPPSRTRIIQLPRETRPVPKQKWRFVPMQDSHVTAYLWHVAGAEADRCTHRVAMIVRHTAAVFEVTPSAILGPCRTKDIALIRHIAMWLAKTRTDRSFSEIGRRFGGRDHTTVLHAFRRIEVLKDEPAVAEKIMAIVERLEARS